MKRPYFLYYTSVFFYLFVGIAGSFSSALLFSCSSSVSSNPLLLRADSIMEAQPDSALSLLQSIPSPPKLSRADGALYALLLTQARHKNYITLDNDSLIKTAVNYYGDKKNSAYAAKAHYYLGATYRDMNHPALSVDEYLKAIELMPKENKFLAMIYDNLAECYEQDGLNNVAMDSYRTAYQMLKGDKRQLHPLRGIAGIFLMQNKPDSALCYYQQALNCALAEQSDMVSTLYYDMAKVYDGTGDYNRAFQCISKAIDTAKGNEVFVSYLSKAEIMMNLNELDSANYYFNRSLGGYLDIYGQAIYHDGMYKLAKREGKWETAVQHADLYQTLYDSIQTMNDAEELSQLMDKHQLEQYKRELSERSRVMIGGLISLFLFVTVASAFYFLWKDRKRKKHYIKLQHALTQKRVDVMLLKEEEVLANVDSESINAKRSALIEKQLQLCISVFETSGCYNQLEELKRATGKELLNMRKRPSLRGEILSEINKAFVDVIVNLQERYGLSSIDTVFCILSCLYCPRFVIAELIGVTLDALKMRKNRMKGKIDADLFARIFGAENK